MLGDNPGFDRHDVAAGADRHHDLFHRGIASALPDAVDGALHLAGTRLDRAQRVGDREAQIVVAMDRDDRLVDIGHAVLDHTDQIRELLGIGIADRVRDVDRGSTCGNRTFDAATKEVRLGPRAVLAGPLDIVHVISCARHAVDHGLMNILRSHLQLHAHMQGTGRDEGVDALSLGRLQGLRSPVDVRDLRSGEGADHAVLDALGDFVDRLKIALGGDREARLDDVDTHLLQEFRDLDFFRHGHRGAGRLLAVAKGGVEDDNVLGRRRRLGYVRCWILHFLISRHGSWSFLRIAFLFDGLSPFGP